MFNHSQFCFSLLLIVTVGYQQTEVEAQVVGLGRCPQFQAVPDFKLQEFMGDWYENRKYISDYEVGLRCVTLTLKSNKDNSVTVLNNGTQLFPGRKIVTSGIATRDDTTGKFLVSFPEHILGDPITPYLVLGTDYVNYSVIWSCIVRGPIYLHTLWIHTRSPNPSMAVIDSALTVVRQNYLNTRKLMLTRNFFC